MPHSTPIRALVDVTDLVEFTARAESPSGVQRVVLGVLPLLLERGAAAIALDRGRGVFVGVEAEGLNDVVRPSTGSAGAANSLISELASRPAVEVDAQTVILFPGAVWINDSLMLAARGLHAAGAQLVFYLYDLTPVLEAGHTAAVNQLYERYLVLISDLGARVPAISRSSRCDLETWCEAKGRRTPPGIATGLPNALDPDDFPTAPSPWPRPYSLFVGTIEARKNHALAFGAWKRLVDRHGRDAVPDLVCIGRLGWHADDFLRAMTETAGLNGKVFVLTSSVPDFELAQFYRHALFSIYPSRYEGWGLPVSESLAFGVPVIAADNSSIREAGGDAAIYVPTSDVDALVRAVETNFLDPVSPPLSGSDLIARSPLPPTWQQVAEMLMEEVRLAHSHKVVDMVPAIELGNEYVLGSPPPEPDGAHADVFLRHLTRVSRTPLLRQTRRERDFEVTDAAITGTFGAPQTWGLQLFPGLPSTVRFARPEAGPLTLLIATRSMPGRAWVETISPSGTDRLDVYLGAVLPVPLGDGAEGEIAQARITVVDATDSVEGFVGITSFVVLRADDLTAQLAIERAASQALRQELDFMMGTRSWKVTAPLRRWKGRGAK